MQIRVIFNDNNYALTHTHLPHIVYHYENARCK